MSKVKSPVKKKALSLKRDRRNTYGENAASSRKNIARGKQRSHQEERHAVAQVLGSLGLSPAEDEMDATQSEVKVVASIKKRKAFKKIPDAPLGEVLGKLKPPPKRKRTDRS